MVALPFPEPPLSDGVVALRPLRNDDIPIMAAWGRDPVIVRWTAVPADQSERSVRAYAVRAEEARQLGVMVALSIVDASSGGLLGSCDVRCPDPTDSAIGELGYVVRAEARGQGVATRAVRLLTGWSLSELGMRRIQALVHPDNGASTRVLEHLGFTREGLLRGYRAGPRGREDRVIFAILPGELT